jgi:hypothetical protein
MMRAVLTTIVGALSIVAVSATPAAAQTMDERVRFTFTTPVAVPGAVLPAGDYVFRLADPNSGRKTIQVLSADMKKVHAMFFANEIMRGEEARGHLASLGEARIGTPRSVEGLWSPGSSYGRGFLYAPGEASWERRQASAN